MTLRIATYNVHKGFSQFNRRMVVHELRSHLRLIDADIVLRRALLLEWHVGCIEGERRHARRHGGGEDAVVDGSWSNLRL